MHLFNFTRGLEMATEERGEVVDLVVLDVIISFQDISGRILEKL